MDEDKPKIRWATYAIAALWAVFLIVTAWVAPYCDAMYREWKYELPLGTRIVLGMPLVGSPGRPHPGGGGRGAVPVGLAVGNHAIRSRP